MAFWSREAPFPGENDDNARAQKGNIKLSAPLMKPPFVLRGQVVSNPEEEVQKEMSRTRGGGDSTAVPRNGPRAHQPIMSGITYFESTAGDASSTRLCVKFPLLEPSQPASRA